MQTVNAAMKLKDACSFGRKAMTNLDSIFKSRDITLLTKVHIVKKLWFSSSHVWMWELNPKEGWAPKNWCFWTMVLEKTLESSLDSKIKPINPKGNQPWIFTGKTDAEAPILWLPNVKSWLIGKDPGGGNDWGQEEEVTGLDGWTASPTQWAWMWTNSGRRWRTRSWGAAGHRVA